MFSGIVEEYATLVALVKDQELSLIHIYFFRIEFCLFNNIHNIIYTIEKYNTFFGVNPFPINIHRRIIAILIVANYFQCCIDRILCCLLYTSIPPGH